MSDSTANSPEAEPVHIVPVSDKYEHILSEFCPCEPSVEIANNVPIYIHNAYDHRELFEDLEEFLNDKGE